MEDYTDSEKKYGKEIFTDEDRVLLKRLKHVGLHPVKRYNLTGGD